MNRKQYRRRTRKKASRYHSRRTSRKKHIKGIHGFLARAGMMVLIAAVTVLAIQSCTEKSAGTGIGVDASMPEIDVQLLDINEYSRPGIASDGIRGIVIHYTANPGTSAQANRDYFQGLKDSGETSASSNFVVGLEGEIIQCVPTWEIAYASNSRNHDSISIECCHPDETGEFTDETYRSVVQLTAWLCVKYGLTEQEVIRHYDVTGKNCPKYFVEHEDAWKNFRADVAAAIAET